jgi:hypothetical protein
VRRSRSFFRLSQAAHVLIASQNIELVVSTDVERLSNGSLSYLVINFLRNYPGSVADLMKSTR